MKIFAASINSKFKVFSREPGIFFGYNHVLKRTQSKKYNFSLTIFNGKNIDTFITAKPKIYLHIPTNTWSFLTGKIREYFLPWRWKVTYLDSEVGNSLPIRALICTAVKGELPYSLIDHALGKSWFQTYLFKKGCYEEVFQKEFIFEQTHNTHTTHFKDFFGTSSRRLTDNKIYNHIFRARSIYSTIKYFYLKHFSHAWKEVTIPTPLGSYNILIKKTDEASISTLGIIK